MTKQVTTALTPLLCLILMLSLTVDAAFSQSSGKKRRKPQLIGIMELETDDGSESKEVLPTDGRQLGTIELQKIEKPKDPYLIRRDSAIEYLQQLKEHLAQLQSGEIKKISDASDQVLTHLTRIYLLCAIKRGLCSEMLDAVLEIDLINSRIDKKASCSNLRRFWGIWLKSGLQKKRDYNIKTGYISKVKKFRKEKLSSYLKCRDTITAEAVLTNEAIQDKEFFQKRYAPDSNAVMAVRKALAFTNYYKKKNVHVTKAINKF